MDRFKDFTHNETDPSGRLTASDLNAIQDDIEQGFSAWKPLSQIESTVTIGSHVPNTWPVGQLAPAGQTFRLDPATLAAPGAAPVPRAVQLRFTGYLLASAAGFGTRIMVALCPATVSVALPNTPLRVVLGGPALRSVEVADPGMPAAIADFTSVEFPMPPPGRYVMACCPLDRNVTTSANFYAALQYRQV
ncbi:MAG TPA: hypothetical protein VN238_18355 [Solirubrobacteraceae bacterium]|nr:hypothetical protein [Solirubrobacteraceae bacterium]